jgi:hypothetical protein
MSFAEGYAKAVRAKNLRSEPDTDRSPSDLLGAAGLAGKRRPLAMALLRLFSGDNHASREIVELLGQMLVSRAWAIDAIAVSQAEAVTIGAMVLAWHRDGVCKPCGGHGFQLIDGAPSLSGYACVHCHGSRKVPFESQFTAAQASHALWLRERIEREQALAGAAAMQMLAPRLDL